MYALIASDSATLRSAASALLNSFDPDAGLLFASNITEIQAHLRHGHVRSAVIDPNIPGYGLEFDVNQLARDYPHVRVTAFAQVGNRQPAPEQARATAPRAIPLTGRQNDVLHLLREGRSTKEIARRLGLAVPTVKTHLAALYRQLGARNRVEAVMNSAAPSHARQPGGGTAALTDRRLHDRFPQ